MEENLYTAYAETRLARIRSVAGKLLEKFGAVEPVPLPEMDNDTQGGLPERRESRVIPQKLGYLPLANF